jgi:hypothetical protein
LAAFLKAHGWKCTEYDTLNGQHQSIADDVIWDRIMAEAAAGTYDFVVSGTPCETFSHSRHCPPGPRPLRSFSEPYGIKHPSPPFNANEKEQLRLGTLFAVRTAEVCSVVARCGGGFIIENPRPWEGFESLFLLEEIKSLKESTGALFMDIEQCPYGGETQKPTRLLYLRVACHMLDKRCQHEKQRWYDRHGREYWSAHESPIQRRRASGERATKALGAWPAQLNRMFAVLIHHAGPKGANRPWLPGEAPPAVQ